MGKFMDKEGTFGAQVSSMRGNGNLDLRMDMVSGKV